MPTEREFQIAPLVPESIMHNTKVNQSINSYIPVVAWRTRADPRYAIVERAERQKQKQTTGRALSNLQNLTASIFGAAAGILGLESYSGFLFYFVFTVLTTALFYAIRVAPTSLKAGHSMFDTSRYFRSSYEFWRHGKNI
ncbi:hypothetical protein CHU98_g5743 [Xylaria longipes]|nr:hypothetical protein CHU98_g5743 [Xylaria longipes]